MTGLVLTQGQEGQWPHPHNGVPPSTPVHSHSGERPAYSMPIQDLALPASVRPDPGIVTFRHGEAHKTPAQGSDGTPGAERCPAHLHLVWLLYQASSIGRQAQGSPSSQCGRACSPVLPQEPAAPLPLSPQPRSGLPHCLAPLRQPPLAGLRSPCSERKPGGLRL
jgi:hypothetical protein